MASKKDKYRLSPSSINTFFRCKRLFYYTHLMGKETPPNIHLYKGSFIHKVLENVFINTRYVDISEYAKNQMATWKPGRLCKTEEESETHKKEAELMLTTFGNRFREKLEMIIMEGKARDINHAWNLVKPKLREHKIHDKVENVVGIIDSIETSYDDAVYLVDYKTSKLYRHTMPEEYFRQLGIYAYLYRQEFGNLPTYVCIHYLRYGEIFVVPVSEDLVTKVLNDIHTVQKMLDVTDIEQFPPCEMSWCECKQLEGEK